MTIEFNHAKARMDFEKHLVKYIVMLRKELKTDAETAPGQTPEGASDFNVETLRVLGAIITASVIGGPWATMSEWGTGSLMDMSNPDLQAYMQSSLWNPDRHDTKIRSRPRGPYTDIFGRQRVSRSPRGGIDLEAIQERLKFKLYLVPPSHALRNALRWMGQKRFQVMMQTAISTFPWHNYLIVTNTR